jgi:hypothetical protein
MVVTPPEKVDTAVMMKYLTVVWVSLSLCPGVYLVVTSLGTVKVKVGPSVAVQVQVSPAPFQPAAGIRSSQALARQALMVVELEL